MTLNNLAHNTHTSQCQLTSANINERYQCQCDRDISPEAANVNSEFQLSLMELTLNSLNLRQ